MAPLPARLKARDRSARTDNRNVEPIPPDRHPAGRQCECGETLSIYNPGPECRRCTCRTVLEDDRIVWATL